MDISIHMAMNSQQYLQSANNYVKYEVLTAGTMKCAVFWDVTTFDFCENRRFGGTCYRNRQGETNQRTRNSVSNN
jgi:hypothetical protein